jgi:chromosomal replication initiation ATPase DnaA
MTERSEKRVDLQSELIEEFINMFEEKIGYRPVVIANVKENDSKFHLKVVSLEQLKQYFEPFLPKLHGKRLTLSNQSRIRDLVELKQMYVYFAKSMGYKYVHIGRALGQRDHSTAVHSMKVFNNLMHTNYLFKEKFDTIYEYIKLKQQEDGTPALADSTKI